LLCFALFAQQSAHIFESADELPSCTCALQRGFIGNELLQKRRQASDEPICKPVICAILSTFR
jgi:hypothetical protein